MHTDCTLKATIVKGLPSIKIHIEKPLHDSQAYKTCLQARKPVFMAAGHRQLLLPSTFEQVMEGCCVGCTQKMLQVPRGPTLASSICCHPRTDHAPSREYQQGLARVARLRTLKKGFEEKMAPWQQPSNPEDTLREAQPLWVVFGTFNRCGKSLHTECNSPCTILHTI